MDDNDTNDFTFCKIDLQSDIGLTESPKGIPDVNKITLKDTFPDDKDLNSIESLEDNCLPKKSTSLSSIGFTLYGSTESQTPEPDGSNGGSFLGLEDHKPALKKAAVRAKVPFEKGYSPMDWLKLTQTHPDLAGLKGQTKRRLVTMDEVKKHKAEGSVWTVLKGRVYNISPYMKFHPGGIDMLMKAGGKDCTSLFNKYHAWVNAEFLLEKCIVGLLDNNP